LLDRKRPVIDDCRRRVVTQAVGSVTLASRANPTKIALATGHSRLFQNVVRFENPC
jgi:hypothetical protein